MIQRFIIQFANDLDLTSEANLNLRMKYPRRKMENIFGDLQTKLKITLENY